MRIHILLEGQNREDVIARFEEMCLEMKHQSYDSITLAGGGSMRGEEGWLRYDIHIGDGDTTDRVPPLTSAEILAVRELLHGPKR